MLNVARTVLGFLPISIPVAGRRHRYLLSVGLKAFGGRNGPQRIRTKFGTVEVDPAHRPQRLLLYAFRNAVRYYARSELGRYMERTAVPGATFVDVGANLGLYSLLARSLGMEAIAVEPEPAHAQFLIRNAAVFGTVLPVAFSDAPGELPLYYRSNAGATSLFPSRKSIKGEGTVRVTTFSDAARAGDLGDPARIGLVKIDVEGFEEQAVAGMTGFLVAGHRPDMWIEVRGDASGRNGGSYRGVRKILAEFGYTARELVDGRERPLVEEELSARTVFDLLFTAEPRGRPGG